MSASLNVMTEENAENIPVRQEKTITDTKLEFADKIPHMQINIQDRIDQLLAERQITVAEAERLCHLSNGTLRKLLNNRDQTPSTRTLGLIAKGFGVKQQWLLTGEESPMSREAFLRPVPAIENDRLLPVMGMAAGSLLQGAYQITQGPVDYMDRPSALAYATDVYVLIVAGFSMEPMFKHSSKIAVSETRPFRPGDAVVIQEEKDGGIFATIGVLDSINNEQVVLAKLNPPAKVTIKQKYVRAIHRVVPYEELLS